MFRTFVQTSMPTAPITAPERRPRARAVPIDHYPSDPLDGLLPWALITWAPLDKGSPQAKIAWFEERSDAVAAAQPFEQAGKPWMVIDTRICGTAPQRELITDNMVKRIRRMPRCDTDDATRETTLVD